MIVQAASYTAEQIAQVLGLHPATVRRQINAGAIRATFLGHGTGQGWRVSHAELERQVRERYPFLRLALPDESE